MAHGAERTALVTGANRGLGFEVCRGLGRERFEVWLTSRDRSAGETAARSLVAEGLDVRSFELDVTDDASRRALATRLDADDVALDVLVHNAGVALDGNGVAVARRTLDVNFFAVLALTDTLATHLRDGAQIVLVSSGLGELAGLGAPARRRLEDPELDREALVEAMRAYVDDVEHGRWRANGWPRAAYDVSKAGLNAAARVLARELSPRRITVNAVCPGWVRTRMGGPHADRDLVEGAASILATIDLPGHPTGGFFRDGHAIPF